ncbi:MAG: ABC transporter ATP-binding protein [Bacteroidales bacterium]
MQETIVELREAGKQYQSGDSLLTVLKPVSLELFKNELLLLMGPSGSGKTTLLSLIGCVIYPTMGEVRINNQLTSSLKETQLAALRLQYIGFIFQSYNLLAPLTGIENVAFPLQLQGISRKEAEKRALDALEMVKMTHRKNSLPKQMSGGEQQRVAIARALVSNPELVLCDEPTGALDKQSGEMVMQELRQLSTRDKCVVVVTHDNRLIPYADRILYLDNGYVSDHPFQND